MGMGTTSLWVQFRAHPTLSVEGESLHPAYSGVFVYLPELRNPTERLDEYLAGKNLVRAETGGTLQRSTQENWGLFERLKPRLERDSFAVNLVAEIHPERERQPPDFST